MGWNFWTEEVEQRFIELYNKGFSNRDIAEKTGYSRPAADKHIRVLIEEGKIGKRPARSIENDLGLVLEMYNSGCNVAEIAERCDVSYQKAVYRLKILAERKQIPADWKKVIEGNNKEANKTSGVVRCTLSVSKKCIYGCAQNFGGGLCRYVLCEGHSRGCSYKKCDKFSQITKTNKRRISGDTEFNPRMDREEE